MRTLLSGRRNGYESRRFEGAEKMERRIQEQLEEYLDGRLTAGLRREFDCLLETYPQDRQAVLAIAEQSRLIRDALRVLEQSPSPGFYARVMNRIEEQLNQPTMWSVFAGAFSRRLVFAAFGLLLVIGAAAFTTEDTVTADVATIDVVETPAVMLVDDQPDVHLVGETSEDRGRVFVTLTAIEE